MRGSRADIRCERQSRLGRAASVIFANCLDGCVQRGISAV
jgi:hypothetical protein